ncbi:MAG TPA: hypothetical protein VE011_09740 [Candidatus Dormibacteraeota bacterium]|nr:hypothetical protein [Candidatus Dormibacteraeota bacterium]
MARRRIRPTPPAQAAAAADGQRASSLLMRRRGALAGSDVGIRYTALERRAAGEGLALTPVECNELAELRIRADRARGVTA